MKNVQIVWLQFFAKCHECHSTHDSSLHSGLIFVTVNIAPEGFMSPTYSLKLVTLKFWDELNDIHNYILHNTDKTAAVHSMDSIEPTCKLIAEVVTCT